MSAPRHYIRILPATDGQWYFVLKAPNGKVVMASETYVTRYDARRAAWATWRGIDLRGLEVRMVDD